MVGFSPLHICWQRVIVAASCVKDFATVCTVLDKTLSKEQRDELGHHSGSAACAVSSNEPHVLGERVVRQRPAELGHVGQDGSVATNVAAHYVDVADLTSLSNQLAPCMLVVGRKRLFCEVEEEDRAGLQALIIAAVPDAQLIKVKLSSKPCWSARTACAEVWVPVVRLNPLHRRTLKEHEERPHLNQSAEKREDKVLGLQLA